MDGNDVNQIPVVRGGHLVGIIARDSILHFIRTRSELGI
jgi:CBS domain-containing protein